MSYRACRGVCIGVDRHLKAGDPVPSEVDAATLQFLRSIAAVESVPDEPAPDAALLEEPADSKQEPGKKKK